MSPLGHPLGALPRNLERARSLSYYDGDLVVELRNANREPYLQIWHDGDEASDRWFVVRTSEAQLARYLLGQITLRDVLLGAPDGIVYVVDTGAHPRVGFLSADEVSHVPNLPTADSYFDPLLAPGQAQTTQTFLVERDWSSELISKVNRRYREVSAFVATFLEVNSGVWTVRDNAFHAFRYNGGWIHKKTHDMIVASLPASLRPHLDLVQLASPGVLHFSVNPSVAQDVRIALRMFSENQNALHGLYETLHHLIVDSKRPDASGDYHPYISEAAVNLLKALNMNVSEVMRVAGKNTGELAASYYRRLRALHTLCTRYVQLVALGQVDGRVIPLIDVKGS